MHTSIRSLPPLADCDLTTTQGIRLLRFALFAKSVVLENKNTMPGKVDKSTQNTAIQGISEQEKFMIRVLFICHGNICRSPISEFVLKDMVEKLSIADKFDIASAATSTEEIWGGKGNPIYPPAQEVLRAHGIGKTAYTDFSGKRARQVTRRDYEYYDYLLCADTANVRNTMRITGPDYQDKIHLLLDYAGRHGQSIADPWYTGRFDETYRDVCQGCEGFLAYLRQDDRL